MAQSLSAQWMVLGTFLNQQDIDEPHGFTQQESQGMFLDLCWDPPTRLPVTGNRTWMYKEAWRNTNTNVDRSEHTKQWVIFSKALSVVMLLILVCYTSPLLCIYTMYQYCFWICVPASADFSVFKAVFLDMIDNDIWCKMKRECQNVPPSSLNFEVQHPYTTRCVLITFPLPSSCCPRALRLLLIMEVSFFFTFWNETFAAGNMWKLDIW